MQKLTYCFGLSLLIFFASCGTSKTSHEDVGSDKTEIIKIKEAYTQQEIPGMEGAEIKDYLHIILKSDPGGNTQIDSLLFRYKMYVCGESQQHYKIDLSQGEEKIPLKLELNDQTAVMYYSSGRARISELIENIKTKEPIYLP